MMMESINQKGFQNLGRERGVIMIFVLMCNNKHAHFDGNNCYFMCQ